MPLYKSSRLNSGFKPIAPELDLSQSQIMNDVSRTIKDHKSFVQIQKPVDNKASDELIPKAEFAKIVSGKGKKEDPIKRLRKIAQKSKTVKITKTAKKNKLIELLNNLQK